MGSGASGGNEVPGPRSQVSHQPGLLRIAIVRVTRQDLGLDSSLQLIIVNLEALEARRGAGIQLHRVSGRASYISGLETEYLDVHLRQQPEVVTFQGHFVPPVRTRIYVPCHAVLGPGARAPSRP